MDSTVISYTLIMNNNKEIPFDDLAKILFSKGFRKRSCTVGVLIPTNTSFNQVIEGIQELREQSLHEEYDVLGNRSQLSFSKTSKNELTISYNFGAQSLGVNTNEIIKEIDFILDVLKENFQFSLRDIDTCNLQSMVYIKSKKNPDDILANLTSNSDIPFLKDMKLIKWNNEVYLYSPNMDVSKGGGIPITEDIKKKMLIQTSGKKNIGWNKIILRPRTDMYSLVLDYENANVLEVIQIFRNIDQIALEIIEQIESKTHIN